MGYSFIRSSSSTLADCRLRKISRTMARPMPTSAAATAMMNSAKIWPPADGILEVGVEGHQVDVDRGEHQLDRQQHQHRVAPRQHAVDAEREQGGAEDEELVDDHASPPSAVTWRSAVPIRPVASSLRPGRAQHDAADEGGQQDERDDLERNHEAVEDRLRRSRRCGSDRPSISVVAELVDRWSR